ncbi:MAG: 50S ribosomal protein L15 [Thermodesulfobacteriota bacterium]
MILSNLKPPAGAVKNAKRVGRGHGSGNGKTSGRGHKGYKSRSGGKVPRGYEGGQMPIHRRVPKKGFTNIFRIEYSLVKISDLARFEKDQIVDLDALRAERLIKKKDSRVKILGNGEIDFPVTVKVHKFTHSAQRKIEASGGKVELVPFGK